MWPISSSDSEASPEITTAFESILIIISLLFSQYLQFLLINWDKIGEILKISCRLEHYL